MVPSETQLLSMDNQTIANRLEALGNPSRLGIYRLLVRAGPTGLPVGQVQHRTKIARSTLSHHLHRLIGVGLVKQKRDGTTLFCTANYAAMNETLEYLRDECCAETNGSNSNAA